MTLKYKFLALSVVLLGLVLFMPLGAMAQGDDTTISNEADQALTESTGLDDQLEPLDGVEIDEVESMPSGFGFWWRDIQEWTSLALTIDPVKKSEKQLKFAEERARLANYIIQNSTDPKVQEKAQKMLEKANEYMQKIEDKKDDLIKRGDEKSQKLLNNIARHNLNKDRILEKIEDRLSPEKLEEFQQLRQMDEEKRQNFLNDLNNNPNVPQEVKDRITNVLSQVEDTKKAREELRAQQKDILEGIKDSREEVRERAKEQFERLREERKQNLEQLREQFKDKKDEIINQIKEGDKSAIEKLKELNQERQKEAMEIKEEMKKKAEEMRNELQKKRQEQLNNTIPSTVN